MFYFQPYVIFWPVDGIGSEVKLLLCLLVRGEEQNDQQNFTLSIDKNGLFLAKV